MPQVPENQMNEPRIACICLNPGGNAYFVERATKCMIWQTYLKSTYFVADTSLPKSTVGAWRNWAIQEVIDNAIGIDYIAHFDWDDISAPARLQRQIEHIQQTGKEVTGFVDMPMYDKKNDKVWIYTNPHPSYSLGNCLFYKREAWERVKFPDMTPEDNLWRKNIGGENIEPRSVFEPDGSPLMIQVVHGANASASIIRSSVYYQEPSEAQEKAVRELLASA